MQSVLKKRNASRRVLAHQSTTRAMNTLVQFAAFLLDLTSSSLRAPRLTAVYWPARFLVVQRNLGAVETIKATE